MLELSDLNVFAIITAWFISLVIGSFWYSPFGFGGLWSKLSGVDMMNMPKDLAGQAIRAVAIASLVQAVALAVAVASLGAETVLDGLVVGLFLAVGFTAATTVGNNLYMRLSWKFWWLNASFFLIVMPLNAIILSVWQ